MAPTRASRSSASPKNVILNCQKIIQRILNGYVCHFVCFVRLLNSPLIQRDTFLPLLRLQLLLWFFFLHLSSSFLPFCQQGCNVLALTWNNIFTADSLAMFRAFLRLCALSFLPWIERCTAPHRPSKQRPHTCARLCCSSLLCFDWSFFAPRSLKFFVSHECTLLCLHAVLLSSRLLNRFDWSAQARINLSSFCSSSHVVSWQCSAYSPHFYPLTIGCFFCCCWCFFVVVFCLLLFPTIWQSVTKSPPLW